MKASEVRIRILRDHARLRGLLAEVESLVLRVQEGHAEAGPLLREVGRELHDFFCSHLDLEDKILVPALRDTTGFGEERARLVSEEHAEQREVMAYILEKLEDSARPSALLARDIADLARRLYDDMVHEEQAMLTERVLRDDVVSIDLEAG